MATMQFRQEQDQSRRIGDISVQQAASQQDPIGRSEFNALSVRVFRLRDHIKRRNVLENISDLWRNEPAKATLRKKHNGKDRNQHDNHHHRFNSAFA